MFPLPEATPRKIHRSAHDAFFVSSRGSDVLVWSRRHRRAVVLSEPEWSLLTCLSESASTNDFVDRVTARLQASSGISPGDFRAGMWAFADRMVALGLHSTLDQAPPIDPPLPRTAKTVRLQGVYLHLSSRCNLHCTYCYNASYRASFESVADNNLTGTEWRDMIDQASRLGATCFNLTGGEPTLNKDCLAIGRHSRTKPGGYSELLTNGTRLDRLDVDELFAAFSTVVVSLDSDDSALHDEFRGPRTYARITRNLDRLCRHSPDNVALRPVLHRRNIAHLDRYVAWAKERFGIRRIRATLYTPYSGDIALERGFILRPEDYLLLLDFYQTHLKSAEAEVDIEGLTAANGCGAGSAILSIGANGAVFPCQAFHQPAMIAGNVRKQTLTDILQSSPVLTSLRSFLPADIEECRDCPLLSLCGNGCAAATYAACGTYARRNHLMCDLYSRRCEQQLWREYDKTLASGRNVSPAVQVS